MAGRKPVTVPHCLPLLFVIPPPGRASHSLAPSLPCTASRSTPTGALSPLTALHSGSQQLWQRISDILCTPCPACHSLSQPRPKYASQRLAAPTTHNRHCTASCSLSTASWCLNFHAKKTHFRTLTAFSYCTLGTAVGNCPSRAPWHCPCGPPSPARGRPSPSAAAARTRSPRSATAARPACP